MTSPVLSRFGAECRAIRSRLGFRIIDQAKALTCDAAEVSSYETGMKQPSKEYVSRFATWANLDIVEHQRLISYAFGKNNVIPMEEARKRKATPTLKLYRKIHEMTPQDIRNLGPNMKDKPQ